MGESISKFIDITADWNTGTLTDVVAVNDSLELWRPDVYGSFDSNLNLLKKDDTTISPEIGAVATLRPNEGKFGGAVAVEESTTNLIDPTMSNVMNSDWEVEKLSDYRFKISSLVDNPTAEHAVWSDVYSTNGEETVSLSVTIVERSNDDIKIGVPGFGTAFGIDLEANTRYSWTRTWDWSFRISFASPSSPNSIVTGDYIIVENPQIEQKPFATSFVDGSRVAGILPYSLSNFNFSASWTIAGRFKRNVLSSVDDSYRLFSCTDSGGFNIESTSIGPLRLAVYDEGVGYKSIYFTNSTLFDDGEYHFIAVSYNHITKTATLLVDGVVDGTVTLTAGVYLNPAVNSIHIGSEYSSGSQFNGLIDELLISPEAHTEEQIQRMYNQTLPIERMASGNRLSPTIDLSPIGNVESSSISWESLEGLYFDGVYDYVDCGDSEEIQITGDVSFGAKIKTPASLTGTNPIIWCADDGENLTNNTLYGVRYDSDGTLYIGHEYGSGGNELYSTSGSYIQPNTAHKIFIKRDTTNNRYEVYVDNDFKEYVNYTNQAEKDTSGNTQWLALAVDSGYISNKYRGIIYNSVVWNKLTSEQEMIDSLNENLTGSETGLVAYYKTNRQTDTFGFNYLSSFSDNATQGICNDGTYIYTTGNTNVYKYQKDGTLITSRDISGDNTYSHISDLTFYNGSLYIGMGSYPTTPYTGEIIKINSSDLSFQDNIATYNDQLVSAITTKPDGTFWCASYSDLDPAKIYEYSNGFVYQNDYEVEVISSSHGYNGLLWYQDKLLANVHEGILGEEYCDVYDYDGTTLNRVNRISHKFNGNDCGQGITLDLTENDTVWWVSRADSSAYKTDIIPTNNVIKDYSNYNNFGVSNGEPIWLSDISTIIIETSVDGGSTWQTDTNGNSIPNITDIDTTLDVRQTLSTVDTAITPRLFGLYIDVKASPENLQIINIESLNIIDNHIMVEVLNILTDENIAIIDSANLSEVITIQEYKQINIIALMSMINELQILLQVETDIENILSASEIREINFSISTKIIDTVSIYTVLEVTNIEIVNLIESLFIEEDLNITNISAVDILDLYSRFLFIKYWDGNQWAEIKDIKVWNGSEWIKVNKISEWNGQEWEVLL